MKRIILIMVVAFIATIATKSYAQNTGDKPSIGTTHSYYVNSTDGSSQDKGDVNNTFIWWVSANPADLTDQEDAGTDFTVVSGTYGEAGAVNNYILELQWNASAIEDTFYLVVQEFDTDGNQCSNTKAMAIVPQNDFAVQFVALEADGSAGDSLSRCAPDIALSASGMDITYDYGTDTVMFQLSASGIYTDWSFTPTFDNTFKVTPSLEYQVSGDSWNTITSGTAVPVNFNSSGNETVLVRASWDNGDTNGIYDEGTSDQVIKLSLSSVEGTGSVSASVVNSDNADFTSSAVQTQTIQARPSTSVIGFN